MSDQKVTHGKLNPASSKPAPSYASKLCPLLTAGTLGRPAPPAPLVSVPGQIPAKPQQDAMLCQGGKCMFFIPEAMPGPDGKMFMTGDGNCAHTMYPISIMQLGSMLTQIAEQFLPSMTPLPEIK